MQQKIVILDFGSQTTQLIGRRIRELGIYSEIIPYNKYPYGRETAEGIIGVILSGSPLSVYAEDSSHQSRPHFCRRTRAWNLLWRPAYGI